jgi:hypothetical protein
MKANQKHYRANLAIQESRKREATRAQHQRDDDGYWEGYDDEDEDEDNFFRLSRGEKLVHLYHAGESMYRKFVELRDHTDKKIKVLHWAVGGLTILGLCLTLAVIVK